MAPKPFNPPRPVASSNPSTAPKKTTASRSKSGKGRSINSKGKRGDSDDDDNNNSSSIILRTPANKRSKIDRTGSASTIRLPSLSPGTSDDEGEKEAEEESEEDQDDTHMENLGIDDLVDSEEDDNNNDDFVNDSDDSDASNDPFGSNPNTSRRREDRSRRRAENNEGIEKQLGTELEGENMFISRNLVYILLNEKFKQGTSNALAGTTTTKTNASLEDEGRGSKRKTSEKGQIRMTEQAVGAVRKYLDTFAREAIARAAWESVERGGTGVLEIEDLERLAPQLVLDF